MTDELHCDLEILGNTFGKDRFASRHPVNDPAIAQEVHDGLSDLGRLSAPHTMFDCPYLESHPPADVERRATEGEGLTPEFLVAYEMAIQAERAFGYEMQVETPLHDQLEEQWASITELHAYCDSHKFIAAFRKVLQRRADRRA